MNSGGGLGAFGAQRYLSLESFRKNGAGVRTPVWFAVAPEDGSGRRLYVYSAADSGKAKRIRRSGAVRIAPCTLRGAITGGWVEARARIVGPAEFRAAMPLLNRKYWPWKGLLDLFMRLRPGDRRIVIEIRGVDDGAGGGD